MDSPFAQDVQARLQTFGRGFLDCFQRINAATERLRHVSALPVTVSTITFTGTLSRGDLPVDEMRLAAEVADELGDPLAFGVDGDAGAGDKRRRQPTGDKRFRYQLPLRRNGKSLKLFHNGSVHATGCTSPLEFLDMADALRGFVAAAGGVDVRLLSFDIQLINALFVVCDPATGHPLTIAPGALLRSLGDASRADFDTERHPSVKIPLLVDDPAAPGGKVKAATVCVFQTGSVSIMGAKRPHHVAAAYEMVCAAIDACAPRVCAPDGTVVRTTTARQALTLVDGYPFGVYSCCSF